MSQQHLSALLFFTLLVAVAIRMFPPIKTLEYAYMMQEDYSSSSSSSAKRQKSSFLNFICFYVDSGATQHMTNVSESFFSTFTKHFRGTSNRPDSSIPIGTANGAPMFTSGHGSLGNLAKVLQVPGLTENLFSVKEACKNGYKVLFHGNRCDIFQPDDIQELSLPVLSAFLQPPSFNLRLLKKKNLILNLLTNVLMLTGRLLTLPTLNLLMSINVSIIVYLILVIALCSTYKTMKTGLMYLNGIRRKRKKLNNTIVKAVHLVK